MSEKVKVTQAQADAIERLTAKYSNERILRDWIESEYDKYLPQNESLRELSFEDFVKILYIGYEVEETYKVGDWVVSLSTGHICQISKIRGNELWGLWGVETHVLQFNYKSSVRYALPEEIKAEQERRLWKSIGREVGEFRLVDLVELSGEVGFRINVKKQIEVARKQHETGRVTGFYPAESFISFGGGKE